jgi:hypothetical protein
MKSGLTRGGMMDFSLVDSFFLKVLESPYILGGV